jgi:hypothetical protein
LGNNILVSIIQGQNIWGHNLWGRIVPVPLGGREGGLEDMKGKFGEREGEFGGREGGLVVRREIKRP